MDSPKAHEESRLRLSASWKDERYRLEPDPAGTGSSAFDRVRLLMAMPPDAGGPALRQEGVTVGGVPCDCRFGEAGAYRTWEMEHPSRTVLRLESLRWTRETTRLGREDVKVGGEELSCLRVEGEDRFPGGTRRFRLWISDAFPIGPVRAEVVCGDVELKCDVLSFHLDPVSGK